MSPTPQSIEEAQHRLADVCEDIDRIQTQLGCNENERDGFEDRPGWRLRALASLRAKNKTRSLLKAWIARQREGGDRAMGLLRRMVKAMNACDGLPRAIVAIKDEATSLMEDLKTSASR